MGQWKRRIELRIISRTWTKEGDIMLRNLNGSQPCFKLEGRLKAVGITL